MTNSSKIYLIFTPLDLYPIQINFIHLGMRLTRRFTVMCLRIGTPKAVIFPFVQKVGWLVGCFELNGPLRQYFSLYRAVSQREGERKEK